MQGWFFNLEERLEDEAEVLPLCGTEGAWHILPDSVSGPNIEI